MKKSLCKAFAKEKKGLKDNMKEFVKDLFLTHNTKNSIIVPTDKINGYVIMKLEDSKKKIRKKLKRNSCKSKYE